VKRIAAIILLITFSALFIEAVTLPSSDCNKKPVLKCAMKDNCKIMAEMMKKHRDQKNKNKDKCCVDCPMFVVTTFKTFFRFQFLKPFNKREYSVMLNKNLSEYHPPKWKPPDTIPV
jgi:hypothetical protein